MDKESFVIQSLQNKYIGDDGAVVGDLVYSKDIFAEHSHFKLEWMSLAQIAKKAMLVNLSDAIAMNAKPLYALIGVTIPSSFSYKQLDQLTSSFLLTCKEWSVKLIGGDTTSGENLVISITIISKSKHPLLRSGMKEGDLVAYTGSLGESLKGLKRLMKGEELSKTHRFIEPTLRADFIYKARKYLHCGLDISDGLGKDLSRLCKINSLGISFTCKVPKKVLCSGEEYEMLVSFPKENREKIFKIAQKTKTPLHVIGKTIKGSYKNPCKEHHFST